ncbi:MAG: alpha/beta fold hydrolase, partial [Acidimicrobiia bacterium]
LTRSAAGDGAPAFLPDGSLLFVSPRPDPVAGPDGEGRGGKGDEATASLWCLPVGGGEARLVADPPGGIEAFRVARSSGQVVFAAGAFPGTSGADENRERYTARKEAGVTALLFESYPIRWWDHYLGPTERRLFVADPPAAPDGRLGDPREVARGEGRSLDLVDFDLTPDGATLVTGWRRHQDRGTSRVDLVAIDLKSGERRLLAQDDADHSSPRCSPDGRFVVCVRERHGSPQRAEEVTLWLVDLRSGEARDLTPGLDLWPRSPEWDPASGAVLFLADEGGRAPLFRVELASGEVARLYRDGAISSLSASPDGSTVYALAATMSSPPGAVGLSSAGVDQGARSLPSPGLPLQVPGRVEEVFASAPDGTQVHSWLVLPDQASPGSPAPLVVFIHGGPLGSWNSWHWRWNPQLLAARGYAVLCPDPALSTGYGQAFVERGRGRWGEEPYTDLMAAVEAAAARPDVDGDCVAAMGGSFGGYMANWIAGHTDRFRCIVTHASLWALDQFHGTTDAGVWWEEEFGDPYADPGRYIKHSPHRSVGRIATPMLVIHGARDERVPLGEALRLWTDLFRHGVEAKFLYFPDEHHWIEKPQNARLWYQTVIAWLDQHLLGKPWDRPALL